MTKIKLHHWLTSCAASVACTTPALAYAQNAPQTTNTNTDIVIVSGFRVERNNSDTTAPTQILTRNDVLKSLSGSLGDTLSSQAGITSSFFGPAASRPVLRGLGAERVLVLTNGAGIIDASASSPDHQVATDGIDAQQVEILRGPAALAYGGQAIGGVINVVDGLTLSKTPEEKASADFYGAHHSVNDGRELVGRGHITFDNITLTMSASERDFDSYDIPVPSESARQLAAEGEEPQSGEATVENSFMETRTGAIGLSFIGERAYLGLAIRRQEAIYGLPGHAHGAHEDEDHEDEDHEDEDHEDDHDDHDAHEDENPFIDLEQTRYDIRGGVDLQHDFVTHMSGSISYSDYTHTEFEAPGGNVGAVFKTSGLDSRMEIRHRFANFSGVAGMHYIDKEISASGEEAFLSQTDTDSLALFIFETGEWRKLHTIEGGIRAERVTHDNIVQGSRTFDLLSGSLGIHRNADPVFAGAQLSYTQRAPSEVELFANGPHLATAQFEIGNDALDTETGLNLEARLGWQENGLRLGGNVFVTLFDDFTFLTPGTTTDAGNVVDTVDGLPVVRTTQDGAEFMGGEFYAQFTPAHPVFNANWVLNASVDTVTAQLDSSGHNVPYLPPYRLLVNAQADWNALSLTGGITIAGDQDDPGQGQLSTDGYTKVDLRAEYHLKNLGAQGAVFFVDAQNMGDTEIRHATSVLKDLAPAPGRNFRVGLRLEL